MTALTSETLHRTEKILVDRREAQTFEEARQIRGSERCQLHIGSSVAHSPEHQAAALTAAATAVRAFGGVTFRLDDDFPLSTSLHRGRQIREALGELGCTGVLSLDQSCPTIVIGDTAGSVGTPVLHATFDRWTAGVVLADSRRLAERPGIGLAGSVAGALAVSEVFQHYRRTRDAGEREIGLSLWNYDTWRDNEACGPKVTHLPAQYWLVGLGHLGQGSAWNLMLMPFAANDVQVFLQDDDRIQAANVSTGLLTEEGDQGLKTRVIAPQLEKLGWEMRLIERRLSGPVDLQDNEPRICLHGIDNPQGRALVSSLQIPHVIVAGLGRGPRDFDSILVHTFPAHRRSEDVAGWTRRPSSARARPNSPAYEALQRSGELDECGVTELAGRTAAAAFVGAVASAICLAQAVKIANGLGVEHLVDMRLRDVDHVKAIANTTNPPYRGRVVPVA
jgi:hypothetical protein